MDLLVVAVEWLAKQPASVATFLGTLAGSTIGLVALLIGALFNAHLNRRRDDRLRKEEARSIRGALIGELTVLRDAFNKGAVDLESKGLEKGGTFLVPDYSPSVSVMPSLLPKFGLLSASAVQQVIAVYMIVDEFGPTLLLLGARNHPNKDAKRGHFELPAANAGVVSKLARSAVEKIDSAIATLNVAT